MKYLLPHIIHYSAQRFPNKNAFCCGTQSITFAELDKRTNQLANHLIDLNIKKGNRVGVFMNRCLETAIAMYGILKAGAAYVPLDPTTPIARTKFLIQDCEISVIISNHYQRRTLPKVLENDSPLKSLIGLGREQLNIEGTPLECVSWDVIKNESDHPCSINILEDDLAYILYTSGSTGTPKGIMHSHRSGLSYAKLSAELYGLTEKDRVANHAPLNFDISTFGYFSSPLAGATTVIIPDAHTKMPASLSQLVAKEKITVWYSVPLALIQMLQRGVLEDRDWSTLRWILYAGEAFPPKYLRALMNMLPHTQVSNIYGPTETNQCTYYNLPAPPRSDDPIPIGQVWGNTEFLILNEEGEKVKEGDTGELLIRSSTNMIGYWKRPDLNQTAFLKKISPSGLEEIYYKTGDLVRLSEDGLLQLSGRNDRQIKTRGFRVELDEIESHLIKHEAVKEVTVFPFELEDSQIIVATVILNDHQTIKEQELKNYLSDILPWYAVPQRINFISTFPRTSSGKVDRLTIKQRLSTSIKMK